MGDIADDLHDKFVDGGGWFRKPTLPPKCNNCGEVCYWGQRGGKWTLMDSGRPHKCSPAVLREKALEGFTDEQPDDRR